MKKILLCCFLSISLTSFSQSDSKFKGLFYKISFATTLALNEDFTIGNDDGQTLINPSAVFINNTFGLQFDHKSSVGLNVEYDWHSRQGLNFLPVYFSYRYNIFEYEDNLFLRVGYGRLIDLGKDFQRGTFYKMGFGFQIFNEDYKNSVLLGLDFSRKRFGFLQSEKISSVSVFVEFEVF